MDVKQEMVGIGARLKEARVRAGVTQIEAAEATGVTRPTVSNWEAGRNSPCLVQFRTLLNLYGVLGHYVLFGYHPFQMELKEKKELLEASKSFSPALQRRMDMLQLILVGNLPR